MQKNKITSSRSIEDEAMGSLKDQVAALTEMVESLRTQLADQSKALAELGLEMKSIPVSTQPHAEAATPAMLSGAVTPELLVVIAAAVTAFLGKKVRIRSAKMLQSPYEIINPWAQQGRVFVQASHNLSRG